MRLTEEKELRPTSLSKASTGLGGGTSSQEVAELQVKRKGIRRLKVNRKN